MKVVIAEKISASAVDVLREPRWTIVTPEDAGFNLVTQLHDADALIVRSAVQVDAKLLEHANRLRVIGRAGVGVDNVDLDAATQAGVLVMNTPGGNAISVAEHTLALMLAMARRIPAATAHIVRLCTDVGATCDAAHQTSTYVEVILDETHSTFLGSVIGLGQS